MTYKVYVTDYEYETLEPERREVETAGAVLLPRQCRNEADVIRECHDADALLNQYAPITRHVIESLPQLKVIGRYGVGVNTIDLEAAKAQGVKVVNVPDYCVEEVSNHALALILACHQKLNLLNAQVHDGSWDYKMAKPIHRLAEETLGLLGFGRNARAVAKKAQAFGMRVVAYDPYVSAEMAKNYGVKLWGLEEVLAQADVLSVHMPLMKETEAFIHSKTFAKMKTGVIFINTSRGGLVDEQALCKALQSGKVGYAGLDVLAEEPARKGNPLLGFKNVIITPHIAWYSEASERELKQKVARGVADVLMGLVPKYLVA